MDVVQIADIVQKLGVIGCTVFALVGGARKVYVWGWQYNDREKEWQKRFDDQEKRHEGEVNELRKQRDIFQGIAFKLADVGDVFAEVLKSKGV